MQVVPTLTRYLRCRIAKRSGTASRQRTCKTCLPCHQAS